VHASFYFCLLPCETYRDVWSLQHSVYSPLPATVWLESDCHYRPGCLGQWLSQQVQTVVCTREAMLGTSVLWCALVLKFIWQHSTQGCSCISSHCPPPTNKTQAKNNTMVDVPPGPGRHTIQSGTMVHMITNQLCMRQHVHRYLTGRVIQGKRIKNKMGTAHHGNLAQGASLHVTVVLVFVCMIPTNMSECDSSVK